VEEWRGGGDMEQFVLDGDTLTPELLYEIGLKPNTPVTLSEEAWARIDRSRAVVLAIVSREQTVYGINTGFGNFADVRIGKDKLEELQENLILSHAAGVGEPLTIAQTRRLLTLRINVLAKGHSGISPANVKRLLAALNANCMSVVPCQGTVGASGDLAPLAHLALGYLGHGMMWDPKTGSQRNAADIIKEYGLETLKLGPKEGLALINGTQLIAAIGCVILTRGDDVTFSIGSFDSS